MNILGISAYYHDSAAALLCDGEIIAACQEERFSRKKHDSSFPSQAVRFCLDKAHLTCSDLELVVFYEKPLLKFERLMHTCLQFAPRGFQLFSKVMLSTMGQKLFLEGHLQKELAAVEGIPVSVLERHTRFKILFSEHHESHAASAFFPSPFSSAAVLTVDGVGEYCTTSIGRGVSNRYHMLKEVFFPNSLGFLYNAFTYYLGFRVNSGEYKVMGLAPYGQPRFVRTIREHLIDIREDGSYRLNLNYFNFCTGLTMTHPRFYELLGGPPREPESEITQRHMDLARSIQEVLEEAILGLAHEAHRVTRERKLCLAGGVALNCVANGRILRETPFEDIWIQPAADDSGGAIGAAYLGWYHYLGRSRSVAPKRDSMKGSFLGPSYSTEEIESFLQRKAISYVRLDDEEELCERVASEITAGAIVGWFQGAMEFGPRALGHRSILGNPCLEITQSLMNQKIKFRESFRPFAPSVLEEAATEFFDLKTPSPYMLIVAPVSQKHRLLTDGHRCGSGLERLSEKRSDIPAVTHVDFSARIQTVNYDFDPRFYRLLKIFQRKSGFPLLVNTSFNVRGQPIVCSYEEAYQCFINTKMDFLILENFLLTKRD